MVTLYFKEVQYCYPQSKKSDLCAIDIENKDTQEKGTRIFSVKNTETTTTLKDLLNDYIKKNKNVALTFDDCDPDKEICKVSLLWNQLKK